MLASAISLTPSNLEILFEPGQARVRLSSLAETLLQQPATACNDWGGRFSPDRVSTGPAASRKKCPPPLCYPFLTPLIPAVYFRVAGVFP